MDTRTPPPPPAADRQGELRLDDGRRLAWSEWGPAGAEPVLFCPGAGMSGSIGIGGWDWRDANFRLVAVDRPGLGRSDPHPGKTLLSWSADLRQLFEHWDVATAPVLAFSQGAPFAYALGAAGLARAIAVVAGQDDLSYPATRRQLAPEVAAMVAAACDDPAGLESAIAGQAGADWLWQLILGTSAPADRAIYQLPAFEAALRRGLEEGFRQGAGGYARDLLNAVGPWPFRLEELRIPVQLWYGALDASTVHSPDLGRTLTRRLAGARLEVDPDCGGALLWIRGGDILRGLLEAARAHGTVLAQ